MLRPLVLAALLCAVVLNVAATFGALIVGANAVVYVGCFVSAVIAAVGAGLLAGVR